MEENEYIEKLTELKLKHQTEIQALKMSFLKANNKVKIGDVVASNSGIVIRVDRIAVSQFFYKEDIPSLDYCGPQLTKSGHPYRNGRQETVWGPRVVQIVKNDKALLND